MKKREFKLVKFVTGESVLFEFNELGEHYNGVLLIPQQAGIGMAPFLLDNVFDSAPVEINKDNVTVEKEVDPDGALVKKYNEGVVQMRAKMSGIQMNENKLSLT